MQISEDSLARYYDAKAQEYDFTYQKAKRQGDFERLHSWLQREVNAMEILEIACGTGHWTAVALSSAPFIVGIDINESMLRIARRKMSEASVQFIRADAYSLPLLPHQFACGMAHSWLSHVPRQNLSLFVNQFSQHLQLGAKMLFTDSKYIPGLGKGFSKRDDEGNTYQFRTVSGNRRFEIVKNFLSRQELFDLFEPLCGESITYKEFDYLWALSMYLQ